MPGKGMTVFGSYALERDQQNWHPVLRPAAL
jgi:hypothetical protein